MLLTLLLRNKARGGGAGFGTSSTAADETIKAKLDVIATMFDKKAAKKITAAKNQIGKLESDLACTAKICRRAAELAR